MSEALNTIEKSIRKQQSSYFGKYRAFVADIDDPDKLGRIKLTIPSVLGEATSDWALPAVAYGGGTDFGVLFVPPVGAQVLAEFLEGDPSAPLRGPIRLDGAALYHDRAAPALGEGRERIIREFGLAAGSRGKEAPPVKAV